MCVIVCVQHDIVNYPIVASVLTTIRKALTRNLYLLAHVGSFIYILLSLCVCVWHGMAITIVLATLLDCACAHSDTKGGVGLCLGLCNGKQWTRSGDCGKQSRP